MTTFSDLSNTVVWTKPIITPIIWKNTQSQSILFLDVTDENDRLFQHFCQISQLKKTQEKLKIIDYGIAFTDDELNFFQTGRTKQIRHLLYCPKLNIMRTNGALKKTFWQYLCNLGII